MDTKKLRQKILDLAIHGKLVPQDPNDEPASVLLERIRAEKEALIKEGKIKRAKKATTSSDTPHYENVPFDVPDGWSWCTISDICSKIGSGSTPRGSNYAEAGIPFFRSQNVYNDGLVYEDIKYITEDVHKSMIGTEVLPKDLLLNITGGSLGRCAIVPNDFERGNVSQHVCILRTVQILPEYLHCFIISDYFSETMILSGSGREGLPKYSLEAMMLPVPPLSEQSRIVTSIERWLSIADILDDNTEQVSMAVESAKAKILDLAIHGKLVPQNSADESASELLKRINPKAIITGDNPHYQIPSNWTWTTLGAIGKWQSGGTPSRMHKEYYGGHIPWLKTGDLNDGIITEIPERITELGLENSSAKLNPVGSILIAMYGATIGKVGILGIPATTNQACCACVEYKCVTQKFLFYFLISHKDKFIALGGGGAQPNISKEIITKTPMPIPPIEEQLRIVEKIEKLYSQLDFIKESLQA